MCDCLWRIDDADAVARALPGGLGLWGFGVGVLAMHVLLYACAVEAVRWSTTKMPSPSPAPPSLVVVHRIATSVVVHAPWAAAIATVPLVSSVGIDVVVSIILRVHIVALALITRLALILGAVLVRPSAPQPR